LRLSRRIFGAADWDWTLPPSGSLSLPYEVVQAYDAVIDGLRCRC
jgi:hypothetical protein